MKKIKEFLLDTKVTRWKLWLEILITFAISAMSLAIFYITFGKSAASTQFLHMTIAVLGIQYSAMLLLFWYLQKFQIPYIVRFMVIALIIISFMWFALFTVMPPV